MSRMNEREIARKLAEREELEPPAGLLKKIKSEIPPSIPVGTGTPRVETRSPVAPRQRWLMAASVVAMIGAGLLALQVRTSMAPMQETAGSKALLQRADRAPASSSTPPPPARMSPPQEAEPLLGTPQAPPPPPKPLSRKEMDERKSLGYVTPQGVEGGVEGGVVGGAPGGAVGGAAAPREAAPAVQPVEVPENVAAPPPAAPAPQAAAKEERRADAAADSPLRIGYEAAGTADAAKPRSEALYTSTLSVRVDPFTETASHRLSTFETDSGTASYELVRRSLLQGKLPDPGAIRVGEVLNGFETGIVPPVEGAPSPLRDPRYRLLCFRLPVGLRVEVEFNPAVVARYRLLGNGLSTLYEIELRPAPRDSRVLTLRLGAAEKAVLLSVLAPSWEKASPGFRLTALAAELAEMLKGGSPRADLAEAARQEREAQKDLAKSDRASELADLVERAARIKRAGE
jgi:hypothetical protein